MPAKIRNALRLFGSLAEIGDVEIRLHQAVLYNLIYRADDDLLVNQHVYGAPAAHAPIFSLHATEGKSMATTYVDSFDRIWETATTLGHPSN
jgi:hypothetical protein